ncbi:DUF3048 domain-containing protein [Filibacter tadaridae]|uniref:Lipoprotein YerB n=2 Tax=Filibacter tadaridae TaxID=2483811 RepID=A0A3P5WLL4_9BACL|nr:Putative lipoprotein YerB precursor [Filibacter tadaridae]
MEGKKRGWLLVLFIAMLLLSACSKKEKVEDNVPEPQEDEEKVAVPAEPVPLYKAPFTGVMMEEEVTRRPVLATINNHPRARPQSGIGDADIIYELAAEGNITRLLALFQSELPEEIGPIRSARDYFVHIAKGLDAFYVAHGYSPDAKQLLDSHFVDNINGMQYDGTLFQRSKERKAPHNSYISGDNIIVGEEKTNSPMEISETPPFSFHESIDSAKIGDMASMMVVRYGTDPDYTSTYSYDAENGTYSRMTNSIVTVDKSSEKQVELSNVLVFETTHHTIDNEGRQSVDIESGGNGLLFHGGIVKKVKWENRDGVLVPMENGVPAILVPGKTWIHIVATNPGMEKSVTFTP